MTVEEAIKELQKLDPRQQLMFQDPDSNGPFVVERITEMTSQGEFPKDFKMPKGYKYVLLES